MYRTDHHFTIRVLALTLTLIQGCATITHSVHSAPEASGASDRHDMSQNYYDGSVLKGSYDNVQFQLSDIDLSVKLQNHQIAHIFIGPAIIIPLPILPWPPGIIKLLSRPPEPAPMLWLEIRLDPVGEEFSIDPLKTIIQTEDRTSHQAVGFIQSHGIRYPGRWPCSWSMQSKLTSTLVEPIKLNQVTCFAMRFDMSSSPDQNFTLEINGINKAGQPVTVPTIRIKKGSSWSLRSFP